MRSTLLVLGCCAIWASPASAESASKMPMESLGREPSLLKEFDRLRAMAPTLDQKFPGEAARWDKQAYVLWSAARACGFDEKRLKAEFPCICSFASDILLADQQPDGSARLLIQTRSAGGTYVVHLLQGGDTIPQEVVFSPNDTGSIKDPEFSADFMGPFKLVRMNGAAFVVSHWFYHPFPKDATWPHWLVWVRLEGNRLPLDRVEKYDVPAAEDGINASFLAKTIRPK